MLLGNNPEKSISVNYAVILTIVAEHNLLAKSLMNILLENMSFKPLEPCFFVYILSTCAKSLLQLCLQESGEDKSNISLYRLGIQLHQLL